MGESSRGRTIDGRASPRAGHRPNVRTFVQIMCEIDEGTDEAEQVEVLLERCEPSRERFEVFKRTGNYDDFNDASDHEYEFVKAKTKAGMLYGTANTNGGRPSSAGYGARPR